MIINSIHCFEIILKYYPYTEIFHSYLKPMPIGDERSLRALFQLNSFYRLSNLLHISVSTFGINITSIDTNTQCSPAFLSAFLHTHPFIIQ